VIDSRNLSVLDLSSITSTAYCAPKYVATKTPANRAEGQAEFARLPKTPGLAYTFPSPP
jgi:hypothetical protein